jgi:hypothetical protein
MEAWSKKKKSFTGSNQKSLFVKPKNVQLADIKTEDVELTFTYFPSWTMLSSRDFISIAWCTRSRTGTISCKWQAKKFGVKSKSQLSPQQHSKCSGVVIIVLRPRFGLQITTERISCCNPERERHRLAARKRGAHQCKFFLNLILCRHNWSVVTD